MYKTIIRPLLFLFKPETIHNIVFLKLKVAAVVPGIPALIRACFKVSDKSLERVVFGITFPSPIGLAAGLDKDAEVSDMFGNMGFGFVEIGTVTPRPQPGNDRPRLFRLKKDKALINRMGFNNKGVDFAVSKLKQRRTNVIIGGNIGKNKTTPNDKAIDDYLICLKGLYNYVDYFVVNVSSPNTPNLRELQEKEPLKQLLSRLKDEMQKHNQKKPILLKIAPDLNNSQLDDVIEIVTETGIDGIVATNTTIERNGLSYPKEHVDALGAGGLSGQPLRKRSTEIIKYIAEKSGGRIPIIGVGGILSEEDAIEKLDAGASLVQLYTGFIYEGPWLVKRINKKLISR
ncbi:MAG: quinone-dependent dihydroorotate dehydrogenase [Bacteroidales bacterium]|nr:quinone-dependent dihydroorotate dehydrogenase [Bacteroidales bacterium]MCF8456213.1 quinone-dependent dihydroorotate dehydrogenase [Bacteroidales bacterium]